MEDYLKHAIELVKAQASVRVMSEDEIGEMISSLAGKLKKLDCTEEAEEACSMAEVRAGTVRVSPAAADGPTAASRDRTIANNGFMIHLGGICFFSACRCGHARCRRI